MLRSSTSALPAPCVRGLLAVLLVGGSAFACATEEPGTRQEGPETLQLQGAPSDSPIVSISAMGTGCPTGSADVTIARDGLSATVRYTRFEAAVDASTSVAVKDCQLAIALRDTEDFQYEITSTLVGTAELDVGQNARVIQLGYLQGNPGEAERAVRELDGPLEGRFEFSGSRASASTSCGPARNVNLRTVVRLENGDRRAGGHLSFSDARDAAQTITVSTQRCR